jgi:hypothetical protein
MAKAKKRVAARKKSSKRGKASAKPARKKTAGRATPKRAKSKVRRAGMSATKPAAKKKPPPKTVAAPRKAPRQVAEMAVETTIIDVIEEPVPGVVVVNQDELRAIADRPSEELARTLDKYPDIHNDPGQPPPAMDEKEAAAVAAATHWRVAKGLRKLLAQVNAKFPGRKKDSDGTIGDERHCGASGGSSDHCPNVLDGGVGVVTAMDITHDPAHGLDAGAVADKLRLSHDPRIKYIISNSRIANFQSLDGQPPFAWRPYTGANPHNKHFHISVKPGKTGPGGYDTITGWNF